MKIQIARIEAVKEQANIEAAKEQAKIDKNSRLEMELQAQQAQAQSSTNLASTPPPHNKDEKLPSFMDTDASDYDMLKNTLLTRYNYTENGYRKRFREATPETEETPDQFVFRLKNYLAKWLELSGSSPENFDALVDLKVKVQPCTCWREDLRTWYSSYMGSEILDST